MPRNFALGLWGLLGIGLAMWLAFSLEKESATPQLDKAAYAVSYLSSKRQLARSSFSASHPNGGTPSQFITWMFSPLGFAEWLLYEVAGEFSKEEMRLIKASGVPFLPAGVAIVAHKPAPEKGKQVVVRAEDRKSVV